MRFEGLDLNLLTALDALLATRSVSAAAKRLHLSQPGVTAALRRLREYFGDELLVQSGRQMLVTPRAQELAKHVRHVLVHIRAEILTANQFDPANAKRTFSVVASDYAYTIVLAGVIAELARVAPGINFEIFQPSNAAIEALGRAEVDLVFSVSTHRVRRHPYRELFCDQDVVITWRDAGYTTIDRRTFAKAGHVVARFGPDRQPSLPDIALAREVPERRIEIVVPTFAALPQSVVGTQRMATLHRLYAEHFAQTFPISIHPCPVPLPQVVETVQWHELRGPDPAAQWLLDRIVQHCSTLPEQTRLS